MANWQSHHVLLPQLLSLLAEDGFASKQLFSLPELRLFISRDIKSFNGIEISKILECAVDLTNDSTLMVRLGRQMDITTLGTFGFALMSCADLKEALKLLLRYRAIIGPGPSLDVYEVSNGIALRIKLNLGNPVQQRLVTELTFSQISFIAEALIDEFITSGEVHLSYSAPVDQEAFQMLFSIPIKFDQAYSELVIPEGILDLRIRTANPAGRVIFQNQCEELLRGLNRVENFSAAIRRILIHAGGEFPMINQVAERLYVSESTLRRRLREESTNFRAICDEVRNVLACQYLSTTKLTVSEIASLLNYTETVSFRRAFLRWNAITPSEYRRRATQTAGIDGFI
ncbi:MAG: AraC family transcriptional regulator [Porticoccaceae bacterium]|nr:AraC family transcriptional regulator [Porticoccaceae bacterium]